MRGFPRQGGTRVPTSAGLAGIGRCGAVTRGAVLVGALVVGLLCPLPVSVAGAAVTRSAVSTAAGTTTHGTVFLSPSHNIGCEVNFRFARIGQATFCQTLSPPQAVTLTPTGAIDKCSGATCVGHPAANTPVLPYMTSTTSGPFLCASRFDGVACTAHSRAFLISRSGIANYNVLPKTTMALYHPASHPVLSAGQAFGWVVALNMPGNDAEVFVDCGHGPQGALPRDQLWTVNLSAIHSFEMETNLANPAAGSVVGTTHAAWVKGVRVHGWDGYMSLGGKSSYVTDGPGSFTCP